ncbi:hypothetical protein BVX99_00570 [bacterium F16]|nr:hypothetical protein BVX99_00570 [bacterium F16]
MSDKPEKKLFFCTMCGDCCRWPGHVRMTDTEVDRIADYLDIPVNTFIETYTTLTNDRRGLTLIEKDNSYCIFFDDPNICHIYPVRPQQCRTFPNKWNFKDFQKKCPSISIRFQNAPTPKTAVTDIYFPAYLSLYH